MTNTQKCLVVVLAIYASYEGVARYCDFKISLNLPATYCSCRLNLGLTAP